MSIKFSISPKATVIDNNFIDNYMAKAPSPVFSLIYIYGCRCAAAGISISNGDIAKVFNVIESDVIKAWKYWKREGLINWGEEKGQPFIELGIDEGGAAAALDDDVKKQDKGSDNVKIVTSKPVYKPSEINEFIKDDPKIGELLTVAEGRKGRTLSQSEAEAVVWMYKDLELPFDVICMLLSYCFKNGKNVRYMQKTAADWAEKGIQSAEAADSYLSLFSNYAKVMKFFGVSDRRATQKEQEAVDKWLNQWNMPLELVELAAKRTVENTGKAAFSYCGKILESWYNGGIKSKSDVERTEAEFKSRGKKQKALPQQPKGAFNNYNQKIYSPDEIEEILKRKGSVQ